jgi:uncharacterized protein YbcC (UPF0753/DUF2309 family)
MRISIGKCIVAWRSLAVQIENNLAWHHMHINGKTYVNIKHLIKQSWLANSWLASVEMALSSSGVAAIVNVWPCSVAEEASSAGAWPLFVLKGMAGL